jgi:hypothetical protein
MKDDILRPISVPLPSLLLAVIIHLGIFSIFIFSFPTTRESFKPQFVFLGSILKDQDIQPAYLPSQPKTVAGSSHLPHVSIKPNQQPLPGLGSQKPDAAKAFFYSQKQHIKTMFNTELPKSKNLTHDLEEIGVQLDVKPYQPLTLSPYDQD